LAILGTKGFFNFITRKDGGNCTSCNRRLLARVFYDFTYEDNYLLKLAGLHNEARLSDCMSYLLCGYIYRIGRSQCISMLDAITELTGA
jgi:hypothetical protein